MDIIFSWIAQYGHVALLGLLMLATGIAIITVVIVFTVRKRTSRLQKQNVSAPTRNIRSQTTRSRQSNHQEIGHMISASVTRFWQRSPVA